jgi:putative ubiquitin-RnfH superfamily antitoxin RatB of RatAB toxin-antitoxin module
VSSPGRKHCVVAYATRDEQWLWTVELPEGATVADALTEARRIANRSDVPWDSAPLGIFGQPCSRADIPREGDRIELYRALPSDPRQRRRERVRTERRASRGR